MKRLDKATAKELTEQALNRVRPQPQPQLFDEKTRIEAARESIAVKTGVPTRRGTGPKARLAIFLDAFDAWAEHDSSFPSVDDMSIEDLKEAARLFGVMIEARKGITTTQGMGD